MRLKQSLLCKPNRDTHTLVSKSIGLTTKFSWARKLQCSQHEAPKWWESRRSTRLSTPLQAFLPTLVKDRRSFNIQPAKKHSFSQFSVISWGRFSTKQIQPAQSAAVPILLSARWALDTPVTLVRRNENDRKKTRQSQILFAHFFRMPWQKGFSSVKLQESWTCDFVSQWLILTGHCGSIPNSCKFGDWNVPNNLNINTSDPELLSALPIVTSWSSNLPPPL